MAGGSLCFLLLSSFQIGAFDYGQVFHLILSSGLQRDVGDDLDVVQSLGDNSEDGVFAVPLRLRAQADEELARRAVRVA